MTLDFPDYKLNLKVVLKHKESSGNVPMKANKCEKPKHGKVGNLESFSLRSTSKISEYMPLIFLCSPISKF